MGWAASVWVANVAMAMAKVCNFKTQVMQGFLDLMALELLNMVKIHIPFFGGFPDIGLEEVLYWATHLLVVVVRRWGKGVL